MRGYFGIGIDGISKIGNMGNLIRTGHAFGAAFAFAVNAKIDPLTNEPVTRRFSTDTSNSTENIPFYQYETPGEVMIPKGCQIVGIEITDDAIELPSFRHPTRAVYVLGGERTSLSSAMAERCNMMIKIPTKFSLNVATAGAIVMYDRLRTLGGFPERPIMPGRKPDPKSDHVHGPARNRRAKKNTV